jgi:hypothetical protein
VPAASRAILDVETNRWMKGMNTATRRTANEGGRSNELVEDRREIGRLFHVAMDAGHADAGASRLISAFLAGRGYRDAACRGHRPFATIASACGNATQTSAMRSGRRPFIAQ